jgi:hypothetical protein
MVFAQTTMSSKSSQEAMVAQVTSSRTSLSGYITPPGLTVIPELGEMPQKRPLT